MATRRVKVPVCCYLVIEITDTETKEDALNVVSTYLEGGWAAQKKNRCCSHEIDKLAPNWRKKSVVQVENVIQEEEFGHYRISEYVNEE